MREIITQLQPGREGGRQGSREREGRKNGGQRESGCRGPGGKQETLEKQGVEGKDHRVG